MTKEIILPAWLGIKSISKQAVLELSFICAFTIGMAIVMESIIPIVTLLMLAALAFLLTKISARNLKITSNQLFKDQQYIVNQIYYDTKDTMILEKKKIAGKGEWLCKSLKSTYFLFSFQVNHYSTAFNPEIQVLTNYQAMRWLEENNFNVMNYDIQLSVEPDILKVLKPGIYKIYWVNGGTSLAAVGQSKYGNNWIAPIDWLRPSESNDAWEDVVKVELLMSHELTVPK